MSASATPATQTAPARPKRATRASPVPISARSMSPRKAAECHKRHTCHTKCTSMSASATPATQSGGRCPQVTRLPRKQPQRTWGVISVTPATQSARPCHQVPRLPRKVHVHINKCYACHAKCTSISSSATPATQVHVHVANCHACHAK